MIGDRTYNDKDRKDKMNQFVGVYDDMLSSSVCDGLVQWSSSKKNEGGAALEYVDKPGDRVDCSIYPLKYRSYLNNFKTGVDNGLREAWSRYCKEYIDLTPINRTIAHFDAIHKGAYKLQISEPPGTGFNRWHWEQHHGIKHSNRFAVWMIYLNSLKDSGHTEFLFQNIKMLPKQGTVVIWPAAYTHLHRASPILHEAKYILTGWFNFK